METWERHTALGTLDRAEREGVVLRAELQLLGRPERSDAVADDLAALHRPLATGEAGLAETQGAEETVRQASRELIAPERERRDP